MTTRSASTVVANYRAILRHLRSLPSGVPSSGTSLRANVVQQFRAGRLVTDEKQTGALREVAYNYVTMISGIKELTFLRELDSGEKLSPRDKVRATAGRVGLGVPKVSRYLDGMMFHLPLY